MMKSEYQKITEEISAAVQRVKDDEAKKLRQEEECRKQYEAAKMEMNTALVVGDKEKYKAAGMKAEEARLELEFYEKIKTAEKKPAAYPDDNRRICDALNAESARIRSETLQKLGTLFSEAMSVCTEANTNLNKIKDLYAAWNTNVMKNNENINGNIAAALMSIAQFNSTFKGQLQRLDQVKKGA